MQLFARSTKKKRSKLQASVPDINRLERVIVQQLVEHIKMNHLDCEQQHGFTSGKSVNTNLLEALNIWSEALMHNIPVDVIYLDYAKAFDTVPHLRLLKQVDSFGIKDKALAWIMAFLDDQRQKVSVHGERSNWDQYCSRCLSAMYQ